MEGAAERTPRPKSPPENAAGLYGQRRHSAKLMLLEKEITSLQEELKSLDCLQPSSRCCQEVNEFVFSRVDPLLATNQNHHKSNCCWTRNWGKPCLRTKWNCCCFDENNSSRRSKKASRRQPGSNTHHQQQGCCCCCCCQLDSLCFANGNRKCCGLSSVSCSKPNCCCSCCGSGSCCRLKLWCNGGAKHCPRCTDLSNCCC